MATNKTCLDRQQEGFSGAGRSSSETTLHSAVTAAAASGAEGPAFESRLARSAVHTSRVALFFAGYGVGTVCGGRFGPVSGLSSGFPARQRFTFLLLSTRPCPFRVNGSQVRVLPRELRRSPRRLSHGSIRLQIDHSHNSQRRWRCGGGAEPVVITEPVKLAVGNVIEARADNRPGCRQTENAIGALEHFDPAN